MLNYFGRKRKILGRNIEVLELGIEDSFQLGIWKIVQGRQKV